MTDTPRDTSDRTSYWNHYYRETRTAPLNPSQFAVFVLGDLEGPHFVADLGCGSGRDALYFASHGHKVLGVDGSAGAVEFCQGQVHDEQDARFEQIDINDPELADKVRAARGEIGDARTVLYARFFVHAITDAEQSALIAAASRICGDGGTFAVEFRTPRDANQRKETASHYRRFVDPVAFTCEAHAAGFASTYFVEGFGFAKFRSDDAHVARIVMKKAAA